MILAITCWICLFTLCQSKYIEVNNNTANDSTVCCKDGTCLCGSLYEAFIHVEIDTVINITSSITLHNATYIGSYFYGIVNNITVVGNGFTVECNNSGILICSYCSNIIIEGITWDQCGNPNNSYNNYAIDFQYCTNISIKSCTFQYSSTCNVVTLEPSSGFVKVQDSRFLSNIITSSHCIGSFLHSNASASLAITGYDEQNVYVYITGTLFNHNGPFNIITSSQHIRSFNPYASASLAIITEYKPHNVYVYITETLFEYNGASDYTKSSTLFCDLDAQQIVKLQIENVTVSSSSGLGGYFECDSLHNISIRLANVTFHNNSGGGSIVKISQASDSEVMIFSSNYISNANGALKILTSSTISNIIFHRLTITKNKGSFGYHIDIDEIIDQGTGILIQSFSSSKVNISHCNIYGNIYDNVGEKSSIVYLKGPLELTVMSCNFANNVGSALYVSNCTLELEGYVLFMNNSAGRGAAMYLDQGSQIAIKKNSTIEFNRNNALQWGGAIYIELSSFCHEIVFSNLSNTSNVLFTNNLAVVGNSVYFSMLKSCNKHVTRDNSTNPYKFNCAHPPGLLEPPAASPYKINMNSITCDSSNETSHISRKIMLGQLMKINATICDYCGNVGETIQFLVECTNCSDGYRLSSDRVLIHKGSFDVKFLAEKNLDINKSTIVALNLSSLLPNEYKQLTATMSLELSPCHSGYVFDTNHCKCYEHSEDIVRCQQNYAEIKYGYWFGDVDSQRRTSLCPIHYCDYDSDAATSNGYYMLPEELNDQCSLHRTGVACGECKPGYKLTYDSPDCINVDKCSTGMTVLVVVLTILYWIIVVVLVFGLMQFKVSLGYLYALIYYYSIIDILLGSNLFISDGVFQLVTILSSFAKLTPQFLGKLCFVKGLNGIDQLFIHYFHAMSISFIIVGIVIVARHSHKVTSFVSRCIIRVICLLILLSYTSLASTSFQLLRPLYFDDIDRAHIYSSPSIKYFTGRHIPYVIIALLCGLFIVIGLPLLLLLEPFLKRKVNFIKIKPLLDQFQECYKDQYHLFAAYYLLCRQVIIAIIYISNFINSLYYLQTVCVFIVMIHAWIKPYKSETLNMLDGIILLTVVLVINLNSFAFSTGKSTKITAIIVILVIFPLLLSCLVYAKKFFYSLKCKKIGKNREIKLK